MWHFNCKVMSDSFATPWTIARQTPVSTGFSTILGWVAIPFSWGSSQPNPGIKTESPVSPILQVGSSLLEPLGKP